MSTSDARPVSTSSAEIETLRLVVEEELLICRALLTSSEAVQAALRPPLDLDALDTAVNRRAAELQALERLEARARSIRAAEFVPDEDFTSNLALLQDYIRRVREADETARRTARHAMENLRLEIRGVNAGKEVLFRYRGPSDHPPRFADKRG